ncbi:MULTISPECIES: isoprenyl transferase [Chryseobacterium]|uniref:Isoprenyl transferase n=1 Tax=Chryseobacterium salivictor TaxID=2547600 RepID=A0A4P6ZDR2_9FLAO|nr:MULTISPECIES: isoprenyl transferase [Chryseobacterium]MDQ0476617.1 undecaprenyl diphosphate synthase [Chryseobacterium sp. MDT2-18]QBO57522.1 Ditrans,polycis-undecaprenyl-diphosphate synthase ((2E,6E)-farnesyl-diphosphate specific) [Chryseobacterium salivictor]
MQSIKEKLNPDHLPKHVAIIMDGNGRWAKSRGKERTFGHKHAIQAVRNAVNACNEINIPYLTLYTFSSENWNRPQDEVSTLMSLISETLLLEAEDIFSKGLRMHIIGDIKKLPPLVQEQLMQLVEITKNNDRGNLVLALSYGSQKEILNAVKQISAEVKSGQLNEEDITEEVFEKHLYTKDLPPVDLLVRTSGEVRISNFLLWQIAYAELQFLDILWPDFGKEDFFRCIYDYQNKERRFGKTSEQLDEQI